MTTGQPVAPSTQGFIPLKESVPRVEDVTPRSARHPQQDSNNRLRCPGHRFSNNKNTDSLLVMDLEDLDEDAGALEEGVSETDSQGVDLEDSTTPTQDGEEVTGYPSNPNNQHMPTLRQMWFLRSRIL